MTLFSEKMVDLLEGWLNSYDHLISLREDDHNPDEEQNRPKTEDNLRLRRNTE